jgi:hypothetical protein
MKCIFCKCDSSTSRSVEHIIPESLGNISNILPRGIVCDGCNNYFARKVEKPILDSDYFTHSRFRNIIPNKRGLIPSIEGVIGPENVELGLNRDLSGSVAIYPIKEKDSSRFINYVLSSQLAEFL